MNAPLDCVLVVDDDEVDRLICRHALTHGASVSPEVVEACSAREAIALAGARHFDCILLDYRLPDMNGLELMGLLPQRSEDVPVPVVMLTGARDLAVAVEAMRQGASDYLVKDVEGNYQSLIPVVTQRAANERNLRREKLRAERALERYRIELQHLTRKLMAQEKITTRRLAQALHDHLGQTLAALRLGFDAVTAAPADRRGEAFDRQSPRMTRLIDQAVHEVRRVLVELRPPMLDDAGLAAALDNELRSRSSDPERVALRLDLAPDCASQRWPADVEYAAFMVAREALSNALQHANPATVQLRVEGGPDCLDLLIEDDGRGIDETRRAGRPGHLGLVGIRERASAIGATCTVQRNEVSGTSVRMHWKRP